MKRNDPYAGMRDEDRRALASRPWGLAARQRQEEAEERAKRAIEGLERDGILTIIEED